MKVTDHGNHGVKSPRPHNIDTRDHESQARQKMLLRTNARSSRDSIRDTSRGFLSATNWRRERVIRRARWRHGRGWRRYQVAAWEAIIKINDSVVHVLIVGYRYLVKILLIFFHKTLWIIPLTLAWSAY